MMTRVQLLGWIGVFMMAFYAVFAGFHALRGISYPVDPLMAIGWALEGMLYFIGYIKQQRRLHCSIASLFLALGFTIVRTSWMHFTERDLFQLFMAFWFAYGPALDVVRGLRKQLKNPEAV